MKTLLLTSILAASSAAMPAVLGTAEPTAVADVGDEFPNFEITEWVNFPEGASTIHDLRGRVILIDFWRTW